MTDREQRGLAIAALCRIEQKNGQWVVPSQTGNGSYRVNLKPKPFVPECTCPDYAERGQPCKHVFAVRYVIERERRTAPDGTTTETVTETLTVSRQTTARRPTYRQNWPAYNAAQTTEKARFQALLADLCRGIDDPNQGKGRPRLALADMVFALVFKVYSTVSGRRFACDLAEAAARGHIRKAPHFNSIFNYMEMPGLSAVLRALIAESSLPLRSVESDFAVDSSGFTSSKFVRWIDAKYGQPKAEYDWVKCHLMCGVRTNIVTAVEVGERYAADSPQFAPLVEATARRFAMDEVSADKAYASYAAFDLVASKGAVPYIAFPANTTARQGGTLAKMYHLYNLNRDDYLAHYHKRSNVESTFSMIKAKFGDHLRSKNDAAMANEALCKVLCHNLCCLIQSHYELGITAEFWGKDEAESEAVGAGVGTPDEAWAWA